MDWTNNSIFFSDDESDISSFDTDDDPFVYFDHYSWDSFICPSDISSFDTVNTVKNNHINGWYDEEDNYWSDFFFVMRHTVSEINNVYKNLTHGGINMKNSDYENMQRELQENIENDIITYRNKVHMISKTIYDKYYNKTKPTTKINSTIHNELDGNVKQKIIKYEESTSPCNTRISKENNFKIYNSKCNVESLIKFWGKK